SSDVCSSDLLGTGNGTDQLSPVQIGTATNWALISAGENYSLALKSDGTLWAFGVNWDGQLGTGNPYDQEETTPVQVGTATDWSQISVGKRHCLALKSNGTLWVWGWNNFGEIGIGTTTGQIGRASCRERAE